MGAVAGHVAGHRAVIGAVAGCAVGHHLANKPAPTPRAAPTEPACLIAGAPIEDVKASALKPEQAADIAFRHADAKPCEALPRRDAFAAATVCKGAALHKPDWSEWIRAGAVSGSIEGRPAGGRRHRRSPHPAP